MDELSAELGRSKSNIFANLRGLEAAGIVEHHREAGARHDRYRCAASTPTWSSARTSPGCGVSWPDKRTLVRRSREILGDARGPEAKALRAKLDALGGTYDRFAELFDMLPTLDGPLDLEAIVNGLPRVVLDAVVAVIRRAAGFAAWSQRGRRRLAVAWSPRKLSIDGGQLGDRCRRRDTPATERSLVAHIVSGDVAQIGPAAHGEASGADRA